MEHSTYASAEVGDLTYPPPAQAELLFSHPRSSRCHRWKCECLDAILPGVSAPRDTGMITAGGCSWAVLSLPVTSGTSFLISTREKKNKWKKENESFHFQSEKQDITLAFGNLSLLPEMERLKTFSDVL